MRRGPLAGRYGAAASMVIFALVPYLGLSAALQPLAPMIREQLHMSTQTMSLGLGMANAGYAVGTILAVQFAQLFPQRRMMVAVRDPAGDRIGPRRLGDQLRDVHQRARAAGAVHEPAADRRRTAAGARVRHREVPLDRDHHERLHLRGGRARPGDRRHPGERGRLAAVVLDRRGGRADGARAVAADLRGRSSGRPGGPARRPRDRARRRGLRGRVLRRLGAHHPRFRGHEDAAAAARRAWR